MVFKKAERFEREGQREGKRGIAPSVDPPRAKIHYVFIGARLPCMISGCSSQHLNGLDDSLLPLHKPRVFLRPFQPIVEERSRLWKAM